MQNFYGINLLTKREHFTNKKNELYCQQYCFDNNYISIGYQTGEDYKINTIEDYENLHKNDTDSSWKHLYNRFCGINKDDFVWVKKDARTYYLGKVANNNPFIPPDKWIQKIGLVKECIWVKDIEFDEVPGCVINQFSGRNRTLWQIRKMSDTVKQYCTLLYETKSNPKNQNKISLNGCINELIHYDDLEDLLGIYLQVHGYGNPPEKYIIHPSTNKLSTKTIEYELRSYDGKKAGVQCKTGDDNIDEDLDKILDLIKNENYTIYVCVMSDKNYRNINDNLKQIDFNELIEWVNENNNKLLLPKRIQTYIELTSI